MSQWLINCSKNIIFVPVRHLNPRREKKYHAQGSPVMSMDVKKELIGNFYRPGKLYTKEPIRVNDHDF